MGNTLDILQILTGCKRLVLERFTAAAGRSLHGAGELFGLKVASNSKARVAALGGGYTKLTNELALSGNIDKIKELLNPPFEVIIKNVHKRYGSVVKMAGDSAIVAWSSKNHPNEHVLAKLALLCCMELLKEFAEFDIAVRTRAFSATNLAGEADNSYGQQHPHMTEFVNQSFKLNLHIGLAFGKVNHIFVGSLDSRAEYFLGGKALLDSGVLLNHGTTGQLVVDLTPSLANLLSEHIHTSLPSLMKEDFCVIDSSKTEFSQLLKSLSSSNEIITHSFRESDFYQGLDAFKRVFIETSLRQRFLKNSQWDISKQEDINQLRKITVLMVQLSGFSIPDTDREDVLQDLHFFALKILNAAERHGGSCRQINCDEKSLTALILWGLEGFSHERGDASYAVDAGVRLRKVLAEHVWNENEIRFSLSITSGKT
ncbi:Adenylate cyclase type 10 [Phlyctochytrium planicorne]|nr:Adenylate cyclase type 10 [Phlyctochytrium planicorne]